MKSIAYGFALVLCASAAFAQESEPTFIHNGVYVEDGGADAPACAVSDGRMRIQFALTVTEQFMNEGTKNGEAYQGEIWFSDSTDIEGRFEVVSGQARQVGTSSILALSGTVSFDGRITNTENNNARILGVVQENGDRLTLNSTNRFRIGSVELRTESLDASPDGANQEEFSLVGDFIYCGQAEN